MSTPIVWLEIPVADINRAARFYESVFQLHIEYKVFIDTPHAIFSKGDFGINGSLVLAPGYSGCNGIKPMLRVATLNDTLQKVEENGGSIALGRTLLRQKDKEGHVLIVNTLIDNQIGYYAEIVDTEGNHLYIYSHS